MFFFTIRRVLASVLVLLVSSFLVFALCAASFDPLARYYAQNPRPPESFFNNLREELGLNDNFFVRYWNWLSGVVTGDFGQTVNGTPVAEQLGGRIMVTGRMILAAVVIAVVLAIVVGVIGAVRQYKASDYAFTFLVYILIALPTFWFAALLKEFVAGGVNDLLGSQVLYTIGEETPGLSLYADGWELWSDRLGHLVLPTISLAMLSFGAWSRFQRAAMLDVLGSDYMRLARAKGLTYRRTVVRHGLRNALIPLTTVVALGIGTLFGGAVITETVFAWPGVGLLLIDAITNRDYPLVQAAILFITATFITINFLVDLSYGLLDPRIRLQ
jgi:glutathione transport system permease protein